MGFAAGSRRGRRRVGSEVIVIGDGELGESVLDGAVGVVFAGHWAGARQTGREK
jgi:hypothetical protein